MIHQMKSRLFLLLVLTFQSLTGDEPTKEKEDDSLKYFQTAAYCIAYELSDTAKKISDIPSQKDFESLQKSRILASRTHLNIVGLTTRTIRQKLLTKDQIDDLTKATFKSKVHYPAMDCYDPHHIFIFYDFIGAPLACIEVCFTCNAIKYAPDFQNLSLQKKLDASEEDPDPFDDDGSQFKDWSPYIASGDFLAIAKICIQAGMNLGEFKTVEDFNQARQPSK